VRWLVVVLMLSLSAPVRADDLNYKGASFESQPNPEADFRHFSDWAWFALGALSGFVGHETGHIATDFMTGHHPKFVETHLGKIPFFAIQPCCTNLSHAAEYTIASAGFAVGDLSSELILQIQPRLRSRRSAYLKGVLIFDEVLAIGYAVSGFLEVKYPNLGPPQSDINSMARSLGIQPWQVGIYLIAPAILDLYRYFRPRSNFAPWMGVQSKLLMVGLVMPLLK
jgi:hypothetical protein